MFFVPPWLNLLVRRSAAQVLGGLFQLLTIMMKIASALIQRVVRTSHGCSRAGRLGYTLPNLQTSDGQ